MWWVHAELGDPLLPPSESFPSLSRGSSGRLGSCPWFSSQLAGRESLASQHLPKAPCPESTAHPAANWTQKELPRGTPLQARLPPSLVLLLFSSQWRPVRTTLQSPPHGVAAATPRRKHHSEGAETLRLRRANSFHSQIPEDSQVRPRLQRQGQIQTEKMELSEDSAAPRGLRAL